MCFRSETVNKPPVDSAGTVFDIESKDGSVSDCKANA